MGELKIVTVVEDGDAHLSPFDRRMSELQYMCLLKFSCPVIYKVFRANVPQRIDQSIHFFVPKDHKDCDKVMEYIGHELQDEVREGKDLPKLDTWFPGGNVYIFKYSGIDGYVEHDVCVRMANDAAIYLFSKLDGRDITKEEKPN